MSDEIYGSFASVYDLFMDEVPYDKWFRYIVSLLREYGVENGIVAELGCGTGTMTELLAGAGYDMIGIDKSAEMLEAAQEKRRKSGHDILYLLQDMREFELYGTVRAIVSVCDSINYVTEEQDLLKVFQLVNNYLDPGGIFIFDLNTEYKYREMLGTQTFADNRSTCSYIWENTYFEDDGINEYDLTLFLRQENGLYRRYEEIHYQRAYDTAKIRELLWRAGLKLLAVYRAFTREEPDPESDRIYFIAQEQKKQRKTLQFL